LTQVLAMPDQHDTQPEAATASTNLEQPEANPTPLRHIGAVVAYDGTNLCGSQLQANGRTVQGDLEAALQKVLKHPTRATLAGRTDAGVHAAGQVLAFATGNRIPAARVPAALNSHLERDIRVLWASEVGADFHPRFSARGRVYRYTIADGASENPLWRNIAGRVRDVLDVEAMRTASAAFIGRQDFAAWQSAGSPAPTTVRDVRRIEIGRAASTWSGAFDRDLITVEIEADAFLYQMVRNIVGALIVAGRGELGRAEIEKLTAVRDRRLCPPPAPPQGLCLTQVKYDGFNQTEDLPRQSGRR
jgi:tRNA pseudouridine38-40 synthase